MTARALTPAFLAAAVGLSLLAAFNDRLPGDLWLTRRVQDLPGWFEPLAETTRFLTTTWLMVVAGTALVTVFDFTAKRRAWAFLTVMLLVHPALQALLKNLVDRPRPDPELVERRATFTSESFPAGHALGATLFLFLAAWLIAERLPRGRARIATWAVFAAGSLLAGLANLYEGVHWPSDVLGSYLWAGAFISLTLWLLRPSPSK